MGQIASALFNPSAVQFLVAVHVVPAATDELIDIDLEEARFDRVNILLVSKEVTDRTISGFGRTFSTVRWRGIAETKPTCLEPTTMKCQRRQWRGKLHRLHS